MQKLFFVLKQAPYFTKQNLSLALQKEGEDLNYWIKKLIKEKALIPLKKGFYISSYYQALMQQNPPDYESYLEYLANILRLPSYLSLEYVLAKYGFIPEAPSALTSITVKSSRRYNTSISRFLYRNIKTELFFGWEEKNFQDKIVRIASLPKAIFDFLYLKRLPNNIWQSYLLTEGRFNWEVLTKEEKKELIVIVKQSSSQKMKRIIILLKRENIL